MPRNENTCTRCPIEINLQATDSPWRGQISIIKRYGYKIPAEPADRDLGFGPWNKLLETAEVEHFAEVHNLEDLPNFLSQAQLAVLNPSRPVKTFANFEGGGQDLESQATQEPFSPNVVRLDISAPDLPSLSFFDLPGVIVQDADKRADVPAMVENLVNSFISPSRSIILLTVPIDIDRSTSKAAGIVAKAGAESRTVGIISKPDRLVPSNIDQWREILMGEKFSLKLGYRVIKNPADPTIDHVTARQQEQVFFDTNPHFTGPVLGQFRERFGTPRLQEFLSDQLVGMIRKCLPEIRRKIHDRLTTINQELQTLPRVPSGSVYFEIAQAFVTFDRQIKDIVENSVDRNDTPGLARFPGATTRFQDWHRLAQMFFETVIQSGPQLNYLKLPANLVKIGDVITNGSPTNSPARNGVHSITIDDSSSGEESPSSTETSQLVFSQAEANKIAAEVRKHTKKFYLADLQLLLHQVNGGVYGIGDPRVFQKMYLNSVKHWKSLIKNFKLESARRCKKLVMELLQLNFFEYTDTNLFKNCSKSVDTFFEHLNQRQDDLCLRLMSIEFRRPMTLDRKEQESSKRAIQKQMIQKLAKSVHNERMQSLRAVNQRITTADEKKYFERAVKDTDLYWQELNELAGTMAYYQIAAKRIADEICLSIRNEYFYEMVQDIMKAISASVGLHKDADPGVANESLKRLMAPNSRDLQRRRELEQEKAVLETTKVKVLEALNCDNDGMETDDLDDEDMYDDDDGH